MNKDINLYIESLEAAEERHTHPAWREIVERELADLASQGTPVENLADVERVLAELDKDNFIDDYTTEASELLQVAPLDTIVSYMDDETREEVHRLLSPCSDIVFLAEYLSRHMQKYGELLQV